MDWLDRFRGHFRGELERRGVRLPHPSAAEARGAASPAPTLPGPPGSARPLDGFEAFVIGHTVVACPPIVPELRLHLATEITPLWEATEAELAETGLPPPFWAFTWPGGQALARYLLDRPETVAGLRVMDFAAGCGLAAIAAARAGAQSVVATEIDPFACVAMALNGWLNDVDVEPWLEDVIGRDCRPDRPGGFDVLLVGDMCYEHPLAERMVAWLREVAAGGSLVLLGDPGRSYLPGSGLTELTSVSVPTSLDLESTRQQVTRVWRLLPADG